MDNKKQGKETNFHIDKNKKTAFKKINRAYSGEHGKVKSILQYASHYFCFKELGEDCTAHLIMQIITCEIKHLLTLTEIATKACSSPEFLAYSKNTWEYYDTNKKNINDKPIKLLLDDVLGELLFIDEMLDIVKTISDEKEKEIFVNIIKEESKHVELLNDEIADIKSRKSKNVKSNIEKQGKN